ncbi:flagellin N-terminal helical domain-containing protein [Sphingomonas immobilis]|uniref:Flagellin n=1 Tax=Sphingomonas immobilis TaxID=3063997 RepID=A0ABT8ZVA2_9SPHN|nr:flagellin [Sphingomonas sp. CA1-15]MDO7841512.1 flagellin [Sphingomonas sp. CA1-15]
MQISTNAFYNRNTTLMQQLTGKANDIQTQISTTKKFSDPSQDVVAYQRLANIKQGTADDTAYGSNIGLAQSVLQQSDTTLTAVEDRLQQASELAVQANDGTLTDSAKKTIAVQIRGILDDIANLANTKDARGQPLYGAATGDTAVTKNSDGTYSFTGTGDPASIPIGDDVSIQATDSASRVFGGLTTTSGATDVFGVLSKFADALESGGDTSQASTDVTTALNQITSVHGAVGARAKRVDLEATRLKDVAANREIDRSALEDTDITAAITELQKTMTVLSATQASFTKLSSLSLFDYLK